MSDIDKGADDKDELLELAWGLIANANQGDWDKASPEWRGAAERWRDRYHTKGIDLGLDSPEAKPKATVTPPLGLVEKIGEQLWKLQHQTLVTGYNENHRDQQINLNTTTQAILQAVIEWADKELIGEDEDEVALQKSGISGSIGYTLREAVNHNNLRAKQRAMLKELKGE